jgi:hypothetical protein
VEPHPIRIKPGTFQIAGQSPDSHLQELEGHLDRMQALLGAELQGTLAGMGEPIRADTSALIRFTGAFTGLSTLLNFCAFTRGVLALEKGMETQADRLLVERVRGTLIPLVDSQGEVLKNSLEAEQGILDAALRRWYGGALAEVLAVRRCIARLA